MDDERGWPSPALYSQATAENNSSIGILTSLSSAELLRKYVIKLYLGPS